MVAKPFTERVADFVDRWSPDKAGRYELRIANGEHVLIHDCYLSRDMANRPDHVWVNHDSADQLKTDCDIDEVVGIYDVEQGFAVLEREEREQSPRRPTI
jgi:hypothetical protein